MKRFRALIKVIISHVRLYMIISHVKIIACQLSLFCENYRFSKTVLYIINRKIHGCLEIPDLFLVLNMILSHSFTALTREISCSTLEINLVFPCMHPCIILYLYTKCFLNMPLLQINSWAIIFLITSLVFLFLTIVLVCISALCNTLQCCIVYFCPHVLVNL